MNKAGLLMLFICTSTSAASFDCTKASSYSEKLICSDATLSAQDDALSLDYKQARKATGNRSTFKMQVKENWRAREQCKTPECVTEWFERSSLFYKQFALSSSCLTEGQSVTLTGTLLRTTYPGPPNYESIETGDAPETYWVLQPDLPVSCATDAPANDDYSLLQLVVKGDMYQTYQSLIAHRVEVSGHLMYSATGNHHTSLMITTDRLSAAR
ncbi:DUF4431 domain-containing protein [Yersinia intermedia]|uniref:DUF4431 domain-containing protein n=1 Tax=Yersinia intermedia TaxID=631 RepID=UPI0039C6137E